MTNYNQAGEKGESQTELTRGGCITAKESKWGGGTSEAEGAMQSCWSGCCCCCCGALAMPMLCMWHVVRMRIFGLLVHAAKPAWLICSPCIGATTCFLPFALTVRMVARAQGARLSSLLWRVADILGRFGRGCVQKARLFAHIFAIFERLQHRPRSRCS